MQELIVHSRAINIEQMVQEEKVRKSFSRKLALACSQAGMAGHGQQIKIAKAMGVTPKAVSKWFNAESMPRRGKMVELASYLGTSVAFLMGETDIVSSPEVEPSHQHGSKEFLTPRQKILLQLFDDLPENEADELVKSLEEKKRHYDELYKELSKKRHGKAV